MFRRVSYLVWASREGSLESALVVLHFLWGEGHCNKGMGEAGHANPSRIHTENVTDVSVRLVCAVGIEKCEMLQKGKAVYGYLR